MKYYAIPGLAKKASSLLMGTGWFNTAQQNEIFSLLDAYFATGGNVIDTGRFYNGGQAEGVIANWLESRSMASKRESFIIVNKACHHYVDANNIHYPEKSRVTPEHITEDLEYSLENMKQKHFDIYLLHRDNPAEPVEGLMDRLEQHRLEGKITVYGVSNWSLERIAAAQAYAQNRGYQGIAVNNPAYSLASAATPRWVGCVYADDAYIRWHEDKGISLIAWAPQASGFFAEIFGDNPPEDIRKTYFSPENMEKLRRCKILAQQKSAAPTNIALAYVFNCQTPMMVSLGARTERELAEAVAALECRLSPAEMAWLRLEKDVV